jgi:GAF domain-containing protein
MNTIALPIKLRDQIIGAIRLQKSENDRDWSMDEIRLMQGITDQVSIALESARLFEDTQRRAERERLAGEITSKIRASNDPQEILRVAARELRNALQASQVQVLVQPADKQHDPATNKVNGHHRNRRTETIKDDL